ncbi:MAG: PEP-CTERM sorting domain-containing protein, partial [Deltaproteobacteria bacterium]
TVVSVDTNFNTRRLSPTRVTVQSQSINGQPIPEPASAPLLLVGLIALAAAAVRRASIHAT